jgi:hypothetical protein
MSEVEGIKDLKINTDIYDYGCVYHLMCLTKPKSPEQQSEDDKTFENILYHLTHISDHQQSKLLEGTMEFLILLLQL